MVEMPFPLGMEIEVRTFIFMANPWGFILLAEILEIFGSFSIDRRGFTVLAGILEINGLIQW